MLDSASSAAPPPTGTLLIGCGALAREMLALVEAHGWHGLAVTCLPADYHNTPQKIPVRIGKQKPSGGAALFALAPNSLKQLDPTSRAAFQRMALLCKSVPCWRLELGTDLAGIAPAVRDAIARSL